MGTARIVIVEDERIVAEDMKGTLTSLGYDVAGIVNTGEEAIERCGELMPDLVTMDIRLAGKMDGITAAREIGARYHIPVIYVTAFADTDLIERASETMPYGYIVKPFEEREIHSAIEMALYKHRMDNDLREREETIRTLLNATQDLAALLGTDSSIIRVNEALAGAAGIKAAELAGRQILSLFSDAPVATLVDAGIQKALFDAAPSRFEDSFLDRWCEFSVIPVTGSSGRTVTVALYIHDISDRKRAELELKKINEDLAAEKERLSTYALAPDMIPDPVAITDALGTIRYVNRAFGTRFGFDPAAMPGKLLAEFQSPDSRFALTREAFLEDQKSVWAGKMIVRTKFGRYTPLSLTSTPVVRDNRAVYRIFVLRETG